MEIGHVLGPLSDEDREILNNLDAKGEILNVFNNQKVVDEDEIQKALDMNQVAIDNAIPALSGMVFYVMVKKYGGTFYDGTSFYTWELSDDNVLMILISKELVEEEERFKFEMAYEMVETLKKIIIS